MALTKVRSEQLDAAQTSITSVGTLTSLTMTGDLTVDTSTLKVDSTNNRVGIGTASPSFQLEVSADSSSGVMSVKNAANGRDTFRSENAAGTRTFNIGTDASGHGNLIVRNSSGTITSYLGGSGSSYLNAGNIGIGTNDPKASTKLQVAGRGLFTAGAPDPGDGSPAGVAVGYDTSNGYGFIQAIQTGVANKPLRIQPNGTDHIILGTGGAFVGIGSTAPESLLELEKTSSTVFDGTDTSGQATAGTTLAIQNLSDTNNTFSQILFRNRNSSKAVSRIASLTDSTGTEMAFVVENNGSPAEVLRLDKTGKVGIGTNAPAQALEVVKSGFAYVRTRSTSSGFTGFDIGQHSGGSIYLNNRDNTSINFMTNNTQRMSLDNSGNLGIGTMSPASHLHVTSGADTVFTLGTSNGTADGRINFRNSSGTDAGRIWYNTSGNRMMFYTNSTERMRIDSHGTLAVGTTDTHQWSVFDGRIRLGAIGCFATTATSTQILSNAYYNGAYRYIAAQGASRYYQTGGAHYWEVASSGSADGVITFSEAMRIEGSGNVIIGKTVTAQSTAGSVLYSNGQIYASVSGGQPMVLTRLSNDGPIAIFYKDSEEVGRISSRSSGGNMQISTDESGIDFGGDGYLPMRDATIIDNSVDIGSSSFRYKDLYLSGNLKAANGKGIDFSLETPNASDASTTSELLDDYEEGVYTVTVTSQNGTMTLQSGYDTLSYTKIGRQVSINGRIRFSTISGASGFVKLSVPFTNLNVGGQGDYAYFSTAGHNVNVAANVYGVFGEMGPNISTVLLLQKIDDGAWNYWDASGFSNGDYIYLAGTYFTAS